MTTVEEFIEHVGVKGMRWGVRKGKGTPRKQTSDYKKTVPHRGKPVSELTNKQLKLVNDRMNLEQNYNRMNPSKLKRGKMAVAGVIGTATMAVSVYNMINSPAGKAAMAAGKKAIK